MNRIALIVTKNLFTVIAAYIKLSKYARSRDKTSPEEIWEYIRRVLDSVMRSANVELTVTGEENIPKEGGFVLYGNHQGMFDVVAIAATCELPMSFVYKQELKDLPLLKQLLCATNSYAIDRSDMRQGVAVIQAVTKQVEAGRNYVIFPEGTRSKTGNSMNEWHPGSFRCALKARCPIVPVAFVDCYKVFDQKGSKRVSAQIHYLKPIGYNEYKDLKTPEIAELVRSRVQTAIDQYAE